MRLTLTDATNADNITCAECGEQVIGPVEFDPDHGRATAGQSFVHPQCGAVTKRQMAAARDQLNRAAPALLAACEALIREFVPSRDKFKTKAQVKAFDFAQVAIAKATH